MKILICTGIFPPDVGGPATYVERIAPEFLKLGHKVRVLTYSDDFDGERIKDNYRLFKIKRGSKFLNYFRYFIKVLEYAKDADVIYLQDTISAGLPTTLANLFLKKKLILKIVGDYAWEAGGNKIAPVLDEFYPYNTEEHPLKTDVLQKVQTWVANKADKIITPSVYLKKIISAGWGIREDKIQVIYNAFKFPIADFQFPIDKNLIVSVGRLVSWKGFDTLIELMGELPQELNLEIIGNGPEEENLKALIELKNMEDKVRLVGRLPHNELIKKLKSAGLFVLNTRYEGLSHILIEALACGTPVITTNVGGNPEVIQDYKNGYLVDYNDKFALKSAILKLRCDKNLQEQFRQNGFESLEKFNFQKMVDDTLGVLDNDEKFRVLMISADETILDKESVSADRMRDYGTWCDELNIVVFNTREKEELKLADNVRVYPTNSILKPFAIFNAYKIGAQILKKSEIGNRKSAIITTQDPFDTGLVGYLLAKKFKLGLNIQLHGDFWGSRYWREQSFLNDIRDKYGRIILKKANSIRVVSQRIKKNLVEKFKISENKIIVAPIFTDIEKIENQIVRFDLHQKYPNKNPIFLAIGRLEKDKNYPLLFRAFKNILQEHPNAFLVVVGDGGLEKELRFLAKQLEISDKIVFEGYQKDLISYYKSTDLYLLTSFYEGWGRSVIEAAAAGCKIVMTDVGVAGEVIKHNESGLVVEVDNETELTKAIIKSLEQKDLRAKEAVMALASKEKTLQLIKKSWQLAKNKNYDNLNSSFHMEILIQKPKNFLITGGAGFIGSHLADRLLKDGHGVLCLDNFFTGREENIKHHFEDQNFKLVRHDIATPFNHPDIDAIFHLASPASPIHYQIDPVQTTKTNVMGTINVLELAKTLKIPVLLASTSEIYGDPLEHPQKETYFGNVDTLSPRACYDEGKRCAETLCMDYLRQHNVDIKIVRIFNTYGPRMTFDDGRVVSNFILQALKNEDITIYGDGSQTRSFQYVDDLINGFIKMMERDSFHGPVNLGNTGEFTILQLAEKIINFTNSTSKIIFKELPSGDPRVRRPDISLAKEKLNWEPKIQITEGLKMTIGNFKERLEIL